MSAVVGGHADVEIGGPDVLTHTQIASAAFDATGTEEGRIRHVPVRVARSANRLLSWVTTERVYGPLQFFLAVMERDMVAQQTGRDHLSTYFQQEHRRNHG